MNDTISGGPAFPVAFVQGSDPHGADAASGNEGMTMLDWFAGQALVGMVAESACYSFDGAATEAYLYASAMLTEKRRREATGKDSLQVQDHSPDVGKMARLEAENRERELNAFVRLVLGDEATLTPSGNVVLAVAKLKSDMAELARLRAGGCARDQRTTQFCAEAVELQAKLDKEREYSRRLEEAGDFVMEEEFHTARVARRWTAAKETKP